MRPVIGVMPLYDESKDSLWMLPGYFEGIIEAGGIPIMLPLTDHEDILNQSVEMCSGLLFTGGQDVSPELYGEVPVNDGVVCCPQRDRMEKAVLEIAMNAGKPVLGICRGLQFINAALGGTLYQDLPSEHPSDTEHHQQPPYDRTAHDVAVLHGTPLYDLLGMDRLAVNSYHHQAVKKLASGLEEMAVSEDGLTEAAFMPGYGFLWAVQWHPEFSYKTNASSRKIFRAFTEACRCVK